MSWIVVKNSAGEGPGYLADELRARKIAFETIELARGAALPTVESIDGAILLGGPMNCDEAEKFPYLAAERDFIRAMMAEQRPLLGICLGAQLMARALGAAVAPNNAKEIGFHRLRLSPAGRRDPIFAGLPDEVEMFHWHGDRFEIPSGLENLATTSICAHQGFRAGPAAYAIQFHPEVTLEIVEEWTAKGEDDLRAAKTSRDAVMADAAVKLDSVRAAARTIFGNFFERIARQP